LGVKDNRSVFKELFLGRYKGLSGAQKFLPQAVNPHVSGMLSFCAGLKDPRSLNVFQLFHSLWIGNGVEPFSDLFILRFKSHAHDLLSFAARLTFFFSGS